MVALDRRWYLDVNRFAGRTSWGHGFMVAYDHRVLAPLGAGLLVLTLTVVAAWWSARRQPAHMAAVAWTVIGATVALGLNQGLVEALARPRPYHAIAHVLVLVPAPGYSFPDGHAAIAGAVVCGLSLARRRRLVPFALLAGVLLAFASVYVGSDYPSDVVAGASLGAVVELVGWPLASMLLAPAIASLSSSRSGVLVAVRPLRRAPARGLVIRRALPKSPDARAMEALRVATQAARQASPGPVAGAPDAPLLGAPAWTSRVRTIGPGQPGPNQVRH